MTRCPALWIHVGDAHHGVHRYGVVLAAASAESCRAGTAQVRLVDPCAADAPRRLRAAARAVTARTSLLQFTDRLWATDPATAATRLEQLVDQDATPPPTIVLHDLPTEGETARAEAYARVAARAAHVVVSSHHERRRLLALTGHRAHVVPHFVERQTAPTPRRRALGRPSVGILGFVYPGKGHDDVVDAAARATSAPTVVALGGPAPGHADLLDDLARRAAGAGVQVRATGWLGERALAARIARVHTPVVPNRDPSASGSLARWLAAGRRPLVRDGAYAREVDALAPGCLTLYPGDDPEALARLLDVAAERPWTTFAHDVPAALAPSSIAGRLLELAEGAAA